MSDKAASRAKCEADRLEMLELTAAQPVEFLQTLLGPADRAVLTGELADFFVASTRAGLSDTSDGWWDDGEAHLGDCGFAISEIGTPVLLLHGRQDKCVPFGDGECWPRRSPASRRG